MGNFSLAAKSLLTKVKQLEQPNGDKDNVERDLNAAGFSRRQLLEEYRALYDSTDEDSVKRQILDSISKIHGLNDQEVTKQTPNIIFNIQGDNTKVALMLNPSKESEAGS